MRNIYILNDFYLFFFVSFENILNYKLWFIYLSICLKRNWKLSRRWIWEEEMTVLEAMGRGSEHTLPCKLRTHRRKHGEECYISSSCPLFVLTKLMWLLKSPLDQNPTMIYHKFNGDFKSYINFGRIKGG
jgi:hypothetical protein